MELFKSYYSDLRCLKYSQSLVHHIDIVRHYLFYLLFLAIVFILVMVSIKIYTIFGYLYLGQFV